MSEAMTTKAQKPTPVERAAAALRIDLTQPDGEPRLRRRLQGTGIYPVCGKCGGTGWLDGYTSVDGGRCWKCSATGYAPRKLTVTMAKRAEEMAASGELDAYFALNRRLADLQKAGGVLRARHGASRCSKDYELAYQDSYRVPGCVVKAITEDHMRLQRLGHRIGDAGYKVCSMAQTELKVTRRGSPEEEAIVTAALAELNALAEHLKAVHAEYDAKPYRPQEKNDDR